MRTLALVLIAASVAACSRPPDSVHRYDLEGQILAVRPERLEVVVKHGDIKGFMPAMTMPFTVKDAALIDGLAVGDLVTATLVVGDTSAFLETLDKTGTAPVADSGPLPTNPQFLKDGEMAPEAPLVDQDGQPRPLSSFRGHRVALTFIYSRCPIPDFCPLMNKHFATVQRSLAGDPALADVRLVSVTVDPAFDTPAVLKPFAARVGANPAVWTFLTGTPEAVLSFATPLGIYAEPNPEMLLIHNLRTALIGSDGRLAKIYTGNEWTPAALVADLKAIPAPGR